jgi:hypothetical protein
LAPLPSHAAAIHDAAKKGDVAAISAALEAGANINESDGAATPLYYAVQGAQFGAAKLLIERGADVILYRFSVILLWGQPLKGATSTLYNCYSITGPIRTRL